MQFFASVVVSWMVYMIGTVLPCTVKKLANNTYTYALNLPQAHDDYAWLSNGSVIAYKGKSSSSVVKDYGHDFITLRGCHSNISYEISGSEGGETRCSYDCSVNQKVLPPNGTDEKYLGAVIALILFVIALFAVLFRCYMQKRSKRGSQESSLDIEDPPEQ